MIATGVGCNYALLL